MSERCNWPQPVWSTNFIVCAARARQPPGSFVVGACLLEKLQFACQHCGQKLRASARRLGDTVNCPKCSHPTTLLLKEDGATNPTKSKEPIGSSTSEKSSRTSPESRDRSTAASKKSQARKGDGAENKTSDRQRSPAAATGPRATAESDASSPSASLASPQPLDELVDQADTPSAPPRTDSDNAPEPHDGKGTERWESEPDPSHDRASQPEPPLETAAEPASDSEPAEQQPAAEQAPASAQEPYESSAEFDFTGLGGYAYEAEETEWVVETDSDEDEASRVFDPHKIAVPRKILYYQGALLAATALFAFVLGMVFGRSFAPQAAAVAMSEPCELSGKVEFTRGGLTSMPDEGSVVIAVPRDYKPDLRERRELEKIASATDDRDPSVDILRSIGGDFAITDQRGQFTLNLPDQGRYYLLVLSANSQRPAQEEFNRLHLSEMGTYFGPAQRLVGDRRFHWRTENLDDDREINILF